MMPFQASADIGQLANYGVLGIFAIVLLVFAQRQIKREQDRADRLEKRLDEMNQATQEKVIPALESATLAVQSSVELMKESQRRQEIEEVRRAAAAKAALDLAGQQYREGRRAAAEE